MPKYSINGHTYESPTELTDDEIDEIGGWDTEDKSLWEKANTPWTNKVSEFGKSVGKWIDPEQGTDWRDPRTALGAFAETAGSTVENMFFTPLGTAMAAVFPVAKAVGGLAFNPAVMNAAPKLARALPTVGKALHTGGRVGSAAYAAEGAKSAIEGVSEGDIPKALMGTLGTYLGQKGARHPYATPTPPRIPPPLGPPGLGYVPPPAARSYPPGLGQAPPVRQAAPPNIPPPRPPNVPPPNAPTPVVDDIAETIRQISRGQRPASPPVEDPFTPVPEEIPYDPRDPRVMPNEPIVEPPPSGTVGPPPTPYTPPEVTTPNMVPQRPTLDLTLTQNMDINPLSELAARRGAREGNVPRTAHAEPAMGLEEPIAPEPTAVHNKDYTPEEWAEHVKQMGPNSDLAVTAAEDALDRPMSIEERTAANQAIDQMEANIDKGLPPVQQFADQVVPPTQAEAINQAIAPESFTDPLRPVTAPPITTGPAGKKGGLRPRQKFETKTFAPGPPRQAPVAPVEAPVTPPPQAAPRLVKKPVTPAPVAEPQALEHAIATNGDQLEQLMADGYKAVGKRTDGAIVMERAAAEIPKTTYAEGLKERASKWGLTRKKAKALGVDLKGVNDLKEAEKLIKAKDPTWSTPEYSGGEQPPTTAQERTPKKQEPYRPGGLRHGKRFEPAPEPDTGVRKWWNEARGFMSVDFPLMTSAAFRQGMAFIGTKYWRSAFRPAAKAYGSQKAYNQVMTSIEVDPLYQPTFNPRQANPKMGLSIAEIAGLKFIKPGEIAGAEGITRGPLSSKAPWIAASDRSFAAFTNHLRAWTFKRLLKDAGIWDEATKKITNEPLAREIADFVNTASGRGKLEIAYGPKKGQKYNLEQSAQKLTDAFFSPRLMFSRMKMMNPMTYAQADPFVRKQYTAAMIRTIGAWWTIASIAELAGGKVNKDPNNADFGKIRIGNTRIDPGGGFQQFLVMTHRLMPKYGKSKVEAGTPIAAIDLALGLLKAGGGVTTSSVSGNQSILGHGYKAETRGDIAERFLVSKLHPTAKLGWDALHASERYPVYLGDRLLQMALPMMVPDVIEALQKDPEMAPLIFFASNLGMGAQTYEGGRTEKPAIMPKALQKYDIAIGAK